MNQFPNDSSLLLDDDKALTRAGHGKRLANYLLDIIAFYIFIFCIALVATIRVPNFLDRYNSNTNASSITERLFWLFIYALFLALQEAYFNGKTFGKLLTKTRVVYLNGNSINFLTAFLRGVIRAIPYAPFTALKNPCHPIHDNWTKTIVVND